MNENGQKEEKIEWVDASKAHELLVREQIRRLLNLPPDSEFSIVRWYDPKQEQPEDATYIIVKVAEPGMGYFCYEAAFEKGRFWMTSPEFVPIPKSRLCAWAYAPFDDRVNTLGQYIG